MSSKLTPEQVLKVLKQVRGWLRGRGRERISYGHKIEAVPYFSQAEKLDTVIAALTDVAEKE